MPADFKLPPVPKNSATARALESLRSSAAKKRAFEHDGSDEAHSGNDELWLISYADLMTLLFGFFVILFSMSTLDAEKYDKFKQSAAESFGGEYQLPTESVRRDVENAVKASGSSMGEIQVSQTINGLVFDVKGQGFFASGQAVLNTQGLAFVKSVAASLKSGDAKYLITVEGHTDDAPISTAQFPSNWELSSARATAVARVLESEGVAPYLIQAVGYAANRPLKPNRDAQGQPIEANRSANRRTVVTIKKLDPKEITEFEQMAAGTAPAKPKKSAK
jgi:chemotaxis protein MotB